MHLCACPGCTVMIQDNRTFANGHNGRTKIKIFPQPCSCGCGRITNPGCKFIFGHHMRCQPKERWEKTRIRMIGNQLFKDKNHSEETKKGLSIKLSGENNPFYNKHHTDESKEKDRIKHLNKYPSEKTRKLMGKNSMERWKDPKYREMMIEIFNRPEKIEKYKKSMIDNGVYERARQWMLNGGVAYISSFIKSPSKPQVVLYELTKQLYPSAKLNYPVKEFNRNIDIAIPEIMVAIEYDGSWWHQDKDYDKKRQEQLETLGWKFLRYEDYIPPLDELNKDICNLNNP